MFNDINEALEWVMSRKRKGPKFEHFKSVLSELGDIQNSFNTIHVAGTNGKGSTASFLRDLLIEYGYKVGTLQSPHYLTHLDRIRINGNAISEKRFLKYLNNRFDLIVNKRLSMFEIDFLIMCDYFIDEDIDFAIIEVGLGGRLDSTNVVDNTKLSIITNIDYDHTEVLGDTLEKICIEKCGIIKRNSKVLVGKLDDNLIEIVKDICKVKNSKYFRMNSFLDIESRKFKYKDEIYQIQSYGKYQMYNATLALNAFEIIANGNDIKIDIDLNKRAILNSKWNGRFEVISENPRIILDGAHNPHGIKAMLESLKYLNGSKLIIFSALKRKNYREMLGILKDNCDKIIITSFNFKGCIDEEDVEDLGIEYKENYIEFINTNKDNYENIIICGSLYFISEFVSKRNQLLIK